MQCSSASQLSDGELQRVDLWKRGCNGTFLNTKSNHWGSRKNAANSIKEFINIKSIEQCPPWSSAFFWAKCRAVGEAVSIHPSIEASCMHRMSLIASSPLCLLRLLKDCTTVVFIGSDAECQSRSVERCFLSWLVHAIVSQFVCRCLWGA